MRDGARRPFLVGVFFVVLFQSSMAAPDDSCLRWCTDGTAWIPYPWRLNTPWRLRFEGLHQKNCRTKFGSLIRPSEPSRTTGLLWLCRLRRRPSPRLTGQLLTLDRHWHARSQSQFPFLYQMVRSVSGMYGVTTFTAARVCDCCRTPGATQQDVSCSVLESQTVQCGTG